MWMSQPTTRLTGTGIEVVGVDEFVADTSALVSLAVPSADARYDADANPDPLHHLLTGHTISVPTEVQIELREVAGYDDLTAAAATNVLSASAHYTVCDPYDRGDTPDERPAFGVDAGETDAVVLGNTLDADAVLTDEFGSTDFALLHAASTGPRLVTAPRLLRDYALDGYVTEQTARDLIELIGEERSWTESSYVDALLASF
jgi:hypothetical protein